MTPTVYNYNSSLCSWGTGYRPAHFQFCKTSLKSVSVWEYVSQNAHNQHGLGYEHHVRGRERGREQGREQGRELCFTKLNLGQLCIIFA